MTPEKQKQKLVGQTNVAQKIFQFVPVSELWSESQVAQAMTRTTGSRVDPRTFKGCLMTLVDAGLVRATANGTFQRIAVSFAEVTQPKSTKDIPFMTTAKNEKTTISAIDLLAGIAQKLRDVAGDIETAALAIEEGHAKSAEEVAKFKQLQALLKGLA